MSALASRVGWCPGALRPMASGDGLILRLKPRGGRLDLDQARRIADVARRHGNGALDLTSRANLQIRGVSDETFERAIEALDDAGLLDRDPAAEAVRNIVASPLMGFDSSAPIDIRPYVAALERRLADDRSLHALPAKFGFVVDDGGTLGLDDVASDIRFTAVRHEGRPMFAVALGGDETIEGLCEASDLVEAAVPLLRGFVAAHRADPEIRRMSHWVRWKGAAAIFETVELGTVVSRKRRRSEGDALTQNHLRVTAPFGRLHADQLDAVCGAAREVGTTEVRLTPWRAVILPGLSPAAVRAAGDMCGAAGLIVDRSDARLSVAACPGAPGCHRGTTRVLDDGAWLARRLAASLPRDGIALHVSGCAKGCAHAGPAPVTLVGREGLYDIVVDGRASDEPVVRGLNFADAARCLKTLFPRDARP